MATEILTKNQTAFLEKVGQNKFLADNFYLTGGTALAGFYLHHRYSEDLDFFSEKEVDSLVLNVFFKQIKGALGFLGVDYQQSFNRNLFFLDFGGKILKTEFTFFPFPRIEKGGRQFGVELDSILDIAVNKLFTIYQRNQARDYIDLYFICREENLIIADLVKKAKIKFDWQIDPIQLGSQFIKAREAKDYPRIVKEINSEIWQSFFAEEARKLKSAVIE